MKYRVITEKPIKVLKKLSDCFTDQNGNNIDWYKLQNVSSDDCGTVSCSKTAYDKIQEGKEYLFIFEIYSESHVRSGQTTIKQKVIDVM